MASSLTNGTMRMRRISHGVRTLEKGEATPIRPSPTTRPWDPTRRMPTGIASAYTRPPSLGGGCVAWPRYRWPDYGSDVFLKAPHHTQLTAQQREGRALLTLARAPGNCRAAHLHHHTGARAGMHRPHRPRAPSYPPSAHRQLRAAQAVHVRAACPCATLDRYSFAVRCRSDSTVASVALVDAARRRGAPARSIAS